MKTIILITGYSGSGKTTLGEHLAKELNGKVIHNGSTVKSTAKMLGWDGIKDEKGIALTDAITYALYNYDETGWEKLTQRKISIRFNDEDFIIIPDWRYQATKIFFEEKGYNVETIKVTSEKEKRRNAKSDVGVDLLQADYTIVNKGNEESIAKSLAEQIKTKLKGC